MRKSEKGVTLIELLTVVVVVAVLASIAVPSYRRYLLRAQRSDATTALLRLQSAEEKFFLQYGAYTTDLTSNAPTGLGLASDRSERGFYQLAAPSTPTGYKAMATTISTAGQGDDKKCWNFSITERGVKAANDGTNDSTAECWR